MKHKENNRSVHEHDYSHEHKHGHGHKHEHSHEHEHEHEHKHDHECGYDHGHDNCHEHKGCSCHSHTHSDEPNGHDEHVCEHCEGKLHGALLVPKSLIVRIVLAAALFLLGFLLSGLDLFGLSDMGLTGVLAFLGLSSVELSMLLYYLLIYLLIGYDVIFAAGKNILHGKVFDEQFLMSIATIGAFAIGDYAEGVAVMLFYQVGELFQTLAVGRSRRSIAALMDIRPDFAVVLREGTELRVSPNEVLPGECILVKPGEKIPLDGTVIAGAGSINTAALTGESLPTEVSQGSRVLSGSINQSGVLTIRVESNYAESTVSKILELVEHAASKKTRVEGFITRFSRYYTPFVVCAALLLSFLPPLFFEQSLSEWLHRGLVFLVVSCPCALVVSVPLSFFGGIGGASRNGILIKGSSYLEQLSKVDTLVFDKTGTLTKGSFTVSKIVPYSTQGEAMIPAEATIPSESLTSDSLNSSDAKLQVQALQQEALTSDALSPSDAALQEQALQQEALLVLAASAELYSTHPIGACIVAAAKAYELPIPTKVNEIAGKGIRAKINGKQISVGNAALMKELGIVVPELTEHGTVVHLSDGTAYLGYLVIADELKPDTAAALNRLKENGIRKTIMLTGDNKKTAEAIAKELSIDAVYAELLPQDKVFMVEELIKDSGTLAFVGDGINDAPVLARADVGIAMGGIGSDAAIESADLVLMDDKLRKLPIAIAIAKKTMRIVRQNISFALLSKAVILILGALGIVGMWIAVFGDVGVMLLAVLNSLRAMLPSRKTEKQLDFPFEKST